MLNNSLYDMIFKRKSFHLFRDTGDAGISPGDLRSIEETWRSLVPLRPGIRTAIRIVPAGETTCKRGQQACILLYSERKDHYLQNIGYLGEQLELSLVSQNIGTLWYGIGKAPGPPPEGLDFVIMIAIAKIDDGQKFRKDLFRSKRKPVGEIWRGEPVEGVTEIVRFAPSACNTQPWLVEREGDALRVYRVRKPGRSGIMPAGQVAFYNQIDLGIFLCFLDLCLQRRHIRYEAKLHADPGSDGEKTLAAVYKWKQD